MPLPTKLRTTFLPAVRPGPAETDEDYSDRVRTAMQIELDRQTRHRRPIIG
mgnify:CR=1 FL=1